MTEYDRKLALTAECERIAEAALKQGDKRHIQFIQDNNMLAEILLPLKN